MNFLSLHDPVQPAIIFLDKQPPAFLLIHINGDPTEIIKNGEKIWNNLLPDNPYHYSFLDEELAKNYLHASDCSSNAKVRKTTFLILAVKEQIKN